MGTPVVLTEGLERVAQITMDDITHLAVGTNANTPVVGDTQLIQETNRAAITQSFRQSTVFQVRVLFANANLPATTEEIGAFLNGSGSPNTGPILVRVLDQFTKGSADLLAVFEITVTPA